MENFIPSIPSPSGFLAPSGALGSASPSPDAAGSSAGVFGLLMNSCLAQAAGAGDAAGAATQAAEPAEDDAKNDAKAEGSCGGEETLLAEGMVPGALFAAEPPVISQAAPVREEGVSPEVSTADSTGGPAAALSAGASEAGNLAAEPAAAPAPGGVSAFGNLIAADPPVPEAQPPAAPAMSEEAPAPGKAAQAADASAVAGKDVPSAASAPRMADAAVAQAADTSAVAGKDVPAVKPERPAGEKEAAGEDRLAPAARGARGPEPSAAAASGGEASPAPGEGDFARGREAPEPVRAESEPRAAEPAGPAASQAAASARGATETVSPARPAGTVQAAPAQREFQVGDNAFVLHRRSDTSVEVTLSPPGIGKLEIEVVLDKGVINANITAADPAGREAIERSLPQIVQALANEGMAIGGFTVSLKQGRDQEGNAASAGKGPENGSAGTDAPPAVRSAGAPSGLVDIFV